MKKILNYGCRALLPMFCLFLANSPLMAAPRIPAEVLDNGLVYCTSNTGFSFNPQTADAGTSMNIVTEQIYNKLFEINNNSEKVTPVLATGYLFSRDGKTLIIYLRHGVQFHHTAWFTPTRDLTADDVVFSLNRMLGRTPDFPTLDKNDRTNYASVQNKIYHEQAKKVRFPYFESIKLQDKIKSVEALGKYAVKIHLFKRDSSILSHLASQYAIIFSQEYALQLNADDNLSELDVLPVGTGPYQVKSYFRNQYVRLERNTHYWEKKAKIENIVIDLSNNHSGRLLKFLNNECQIAAAPELSQLKILEKNQHNKNYYQKATEGMNLAYLAFNFHREAMQDPKIRRAISQAINRQRLVERLYYGNATVANRIIPSVSWASDESSPDFAYGYNPEEAKKVLAPKNLKLNLWVLNEDRIYNPSPVESSELIQYDLMQAGVKVNVRFITRPYLNQRLEEDNADYDLILTGWLTGNLDPDTFMRPILSCNTQNEATNLSHWCFSSFNHALTQALLAKSTNARAYFYNQAQAIALSKVPIIPIANVKRILVVNSRVKGLNLTPFGNIHFSSLYLKAEDK